ncbi:MAG: hypothetical protein IPG74_04715 [Flavobacteriales bacterium]|nr:hypothetical protein [Flavobacteriales bacterium]
MVKNRIWGFLVALALPGAAALGQQLVDDFTRANNAIVGGGWTEGGVQMYQLPQRPF